jgi:hypothetical protein
MTTDEELIHRCKANLWHMNLILRMVALNRKYIAGIVFNNAD